MVRYSTMSHSIWITLSLAAGVIFLQPKKTKNEMLVLGEPTVNRAQDSIPMGFRSKFMFSTPLLPTLLSAAGRGLGLVSRIRLEDISLDDIVIVYV